MTIKTSDTPYTENMAMQDILSWSDTRPGWQQDALRRIILNGPLSDSDLSELEAICVGEETEFEPLEEHHLGKGAASGDSISITEIANPKQVNALAENQKVTFHSGSLNIVYGDNGSGKSGYVRILKHACRSRDSNPKILRDVTNRSSEPQSATIRHQRGTVSNEFEWAPEKAPNSDLSSVSIFDSRSANIHVEKTNDLAYTPFPMQVFEQLSYACTEIASRIDARIKNYRAQTPASISAPKVNANTKAGQFLRQLSANSSLDILDRLTSLSRDEQDEFTGLQSDLAQSPQKAAARLRAHHDRLSAAINCVRNLHDAVNDDAVSAIQALSSDLADKRALSKTASEQLFSASPLPEIGETLWRNLWEAAREYADTDAYPDKKFPDAEPEKDLCVLCQQPLSEEAVGRRNTFESFIKSRTRANEKAAQKAVDDARNEFKQAFVSSDFSHSLKRLLEDEIGAASLAEKLRLVLVTDRLRYRSICKSELPKTPQVELPETDIRSITDSLSLRAKQLSADANSPERVAVMSQYEELEDRNTLADLKEDIIAEIERKSEIASLEKAKKTTAKRTVTDKNKEISDKLITDALRGRFAREVTKLEIGSMPIELQKTDRNAQTYFRVCFVENPSEPVGDVLSEGEH
ncbi:AAA family ATPase [Kordiimonas lacus]|nr:hypothetical protein [Kordiimonas lacus]